MFECCKKPKGKSTIEAPEIEFIKFGFSDLESEIMDEVNLHRRKIGLTECISNMKLANIAAHHSMFMAHEGNPSHKNFPQRHAQARELCQCDWLGETVAYSYGTAKGVLGELPHRNKLGLMVRRGWLGSDTHRAIIESKKPIFFACSVVYNKKGKSFITLLFID